MLQLPPELLSDILTYVLDTHPRPSDVLCVHSCVYGPGSHVLYSRLRFTSVRQLSRFSRDHAPLPCAPQVIAVQLPGAGENLDVFRHLRGVLQRCMQRVETSEQPASLPLELLSLRLNSHTHDPHIEEIHHALVLANPRTFVWLGPDPGHHFSTAIVPPATPHLFRAMSTWTRAAHITLTNIAFPTSTSLPRAPLDPSAPLLPAPPALRTLHIGQATFLPPAAVAALVCAAAPRLQRVRLVDAYVESIWGPRLRRGDVEAALAGLGRAADADSDAAARERVRRVVRCEVQNERIMGGDRAEGLRVLE
ncbi:hypothetical protein PsYK624_149560 [Phanerochaete sordida]|uniref:Uncharacterized protein n=1 Tax=Phanerochaete sordida TaxID=48140 RepID=A0A9P3GPD6_9APHY|nr:hypothetical protein PsYK624_149560 [Phanerochaete sordida]